MNVLLLTSHSIAEYDDLRMLTDLGYDTFSIGAYTSPRNPTDDKRPALDIDGHPDLARKCNERRAELTALWGDPGPNIDWAKALVHPDVVDWADAIIVHHFPERWIAGQWDRIKHKRVIWRTCGQSGPDGSLERLMAELDGLEIVRYSPNERVIPGFAGEDALIRFGKYPADYGPWVGNEPTIINITQHMAQRGDATGYDVWQRLTEGLDAVPLGPGSEAIGGPGALTYDEMRAWLCRARAYVYTGTKPASYTLGLIEALLSGIPVLAPRWNTGSQVLDNLYEAPDIVNGKDGAPAHSGTQYRALIHVLLKWQQLAEELGQLQRQRALDLFDVAVVGPQWRAFLG